MPETYRPTQNFATLNQYMYIFLPNRGAYIIATLVYISKFVDMENDNIKIKFNASKDNEEKTQVFTWTDVSQITVADRCLCVSSPISPMMLPEVMKSRT